MAGPWKDNPDPPEQVSLTPGGGIVKHQGLGKQPISSDTQHTQPWPEFTPAHRGLLAVPTTSYNVFPELFTNGPLSPHSMFLKRALPPQMYMSLC